MVKYSKWKMEQLYKCEIIGIKIRKQHPICYILILLQDQLFRNPKYPNNSILNQKEINWDNLHTEKI